MFAVSSLACFANNHGKQHWTLLTKIVGYVARTPEYGLLYKPITSPSSSPLQLSAVCNASFDCTDKGKSWYGQANFLNGCCWSWRSSVSKTTPCSPPMAETISCYHCLNTLLWGSYLLQHVNNPSSTLIPLRNDSQTMLKIMQEPHISNQSCHFPPKFYKIMDYQTDSFIQLQYTPSQQLLADTLTKPLGVQPFELHRLALGVTPIPSSSPSSPSLSPSVSTNVDSEVKN